MAADLYADLGVDRNVSDKDLKQAYRKLARELHPDRNPGDREAEERFKRASHAYGVLSDKKKRALYDEFGDMGLKDGFDPELFRQRQAHQGNPFEGSPVSLEDLFGGAAGGGGFGGFADLFGRSARGGRGPARGQDVQASLQIPFAEALRGGERTLQLTVPGASGPESMRVRIPPGVRDGGKLRLRGQGGYPPSPMGQGPRGDLVITVHVQPHKHFTRDGEDLHVTLPITVHEAVAGTKLDIPTLDGTISLKVPPGTQGGAKLRLRGKGARRASSKGDLFVNIRIAIPTTTPSEATLEELQNAQGDFSRPELKL